MLETFLAGEGAPPAHQIAAECGMMAQQLTHLLKGRRTPTLPQAVALKKRVGVPEESWLEQ